MALVDHLLLFLKNLFALAFSQSGVKAETEKYIAVATTLRLNAIDLRFEVECLLLVFLASFALPRVRWLGQPGHEFLLSLAAHLLGLAQFLHIRDNWMMT